MRWVLERSPDVGNAVRGLDPERYASWVNRPPWADFAILVVYEFDADEVRLIGAKTVRRSTF